MCWYLKNLKNSSKIREEINKLEYAKDVIQCLEDFFKTNE